MRKLATIAAVAMLAACTTTQWGSGVATLQAAWPAAETAVNALIAASKAPAATVAKVQAIEAKITPEIAALSSTSAPASLQAVIADAQALDAALPPGPRATEIGAFLAAAQIIAASVSPPSA